MQPPRTFTSERAYAVACEDADAAYVEPGHTPGRVEIPEHRVWWV